MPIADLLRTPLIALPLRNVNFGIYSLGSAVSLTGMWMERIAIGWLTWQLTEIRVSGSASWRLPTSSR